MLFKNGLARRFSLEGGGLTIFGVFLRIGVFFHHKSEFLYPPLGMLRIVFSPTRLVPPPRDNFFLDAKIFFLHALKNNRMSKKNIKCLKFNTKHLNFNTKHL